MKSQKHRYFKFFIYLVVIVLVNLVSATLYYRVDLTRDKVYSLSRASQNVVSTLSEPLTIKVFFSKNLPAPHNNTERYLHDLMGEYASHGGKFFNYMFHDVTPKEAGLTDEADRNRKLADDYGISPVQIRIIENDEVKFQQAYMGLVIIHGDMVEKVPAITATDGLEYRLTTAIQNLNNRVSTLLSLTEKVKVRMYLSSSLYQVAPLMGLDDLAAMPDEITRVVEGLNTRSLDAIDFKYIDPSKEDNLDAIAKLYNIMVLEWPGFEEQNIQAGRGGAGLVMEYGEKRVEIPLISSINLPIIGTTYQMADPSMLEDLLADTMEKMIGINQAMGYLSDHGTLPLSMPGMGMMGQQQTTMNAFNHLVSQRYSMDEINLTEKAIPEGLNTLIIARPTEKFTDFELFQIDQALMKGTNLAVFPDAFNETMPGQSAAFMGGGPVYEPIDTGLSKLLEHYGVKISPSYVMDEECFKQVMPQSSGGGEQSIYFAPIIDRANINSGPEYMNNIKGLVVMKISPLTVDADALKDAGIKATRLFSSSDRAWEMKENINLNPMFISPPEDGDKHSFDLAYMLDGDFSSYFAGREIPQKELPGDGVAELDMTDDGSDMAGDDGTGPALDVSADISPDVLNNLSNIQTSTTMIERSKGGKIFVMASSSMLEDNLLDSEGRSTNATFVLNILDHLNGQDDIAVMRSKNQTLNPLGQTSPAIRTFIKSSNIVGLPILVVLFGFGIWIRRRSRKQRIKKLFSPDHKES
ncbi:MAG: Gldg family protein [Desulfobacterium sp.]|nr:Gldg family protein [Desulfobacterium sp.]